MRPKRVTNSELLKNIDENVQVAITKTLGVLNSTTAKHTEILNAADKIIKLRFSLQEAVRKEALDRIDLENKQLALEERKIKLEAIRGVAHPSPTSDQIKTYSRVFNPPNSDTIKDEHLDEAYVA